MNSSGFGIRDSAFGRVVRHLSAVAIGVALLGGCEAEIAPPFAPTGQGAVSGRLFFDADNNGIYTPVGGDVPFANRTITVQERGSSDVVATGTTDAEGAFSFSGLPTGTHQIVVARTELIMGSDTLRICQSPFPVSVYIQEQAFVSLSAKLGCVIPISQAVKADSGTAVTVSGIVTAAPGTYRSDNLYLQDATGGIQVFGLSGGPPLSVGDSIEVSGMIDPFRTEQQIVNPRIAPNVKAVGAPAPITLTTAAIGALTPTSSQMGRLAKVQKVTVGSFSGSNVTIDDGSGPAQMRLDGNVGSTVPQSTFTAGTCYDIVGVIGIFSNTPQLKPRGPADITVVPCS